MKRKCVFFILHPSSFILCLALLQSAAMITAITGELKRVEVDRVHLKVGAIVYELLIPAIDVMELQSSLGEEVTFHTLLYLDGDPSRGGMEPRLIGFLRAEDKRFFEKFTTVKGIGPKTALRALTVRVGEIASAIEEKNARFLVGLNGVGKRTAELIIAELAGKMKDFATISIGGKAERRRSAMDEDALEALMALGERRPDAERLLEKAKQSNSALKSTDQLLREMLRLRTVRS
jgi:holliday junction DNA helicase RuvA